MIIELVHDKHAFITFLGQLRAELADPAGVGGWENATLQDFLEAMQAWATDTLENPSDNPWQLAATLIAAGKSYE